MDVRELRVSHIAAKTVSQCGSNNLRAIDCAGSGIQLYAMEEELRKALASTKMASEKPWKFGSF